MLYTSDCTSDQIYLIRTRSSGLCVQVVICGQGFVGTRGARTGHGQVTFSSELGLSGPPLQVRLIVPSEIRDAISMIP